MARGRKSSLKVTLSDVEHQCLEKIVRSSTVSNGQARRARAILMLSEGLPITHIATMIGMAARHVRHWGRRFIKERCLELNDLPRTGRPVIFPPGSSHAYSKAGL